MLNPTFSKAMQRTVKNAYVAPVDIVERTVQGNSEMDTGMEHRLQQAYGDENWLKLERAGLAPDVLSGKDVLEVCAGTGFLTYHLLQRCQPRRLTVNDISATELNAARALVTRTYPAAQVEWALGDMHTLEFGRRFDVIIGNSFVHHFHDVPQVLSRLSSMLSPGGVFISLHEPTPMSAVVEGGKIAVWPLAILAPKLVVDIARYRYQGSPSETDVWMFESNKIKQVARESGFRMVKTIPWGLARPILVQRRGLHLGRGKPALSPAEEESFNRAVQLDSLLNRFLPQRCFGSLTLVCWR